MSVMRAHELFCMADRGTGISAALSRFRAHRLSRSPTVPLTHSPTVVLPRSRTQHDVREIPAAAWRAALAEHAKCEPQRVEHSQNVQPASQTAVHTRTTREMRAKRERQLIRHSQNTRSASRRTGNSDAGLAHPDKCEHRRVVRASEPRLAAEGLVDVEICEPRPSNSSTRSSHKPISRTTREMRAHQIGGRKAILVELTSFEPKSNCRQRGPRTSPDLRARGHRQRTSGGRTRGRDPS